jgi:hypothetical protein
MSVAVVVTAVPLPEHRETVIEPGPAAVSPGCDVRTTLQLRELAG